MRRLLLALAGLALAGSAAASGGVALPYQFRVDTANQASVQRGARNFVNYCAGCHAMKHLRYSRIAQDLGIPEDLLKSSLMFDTDKVGDPIGTAMPAASAAWFGQQPPDLTVETRMRGADWVYNYLMTFYVDPQRPLGTNNLVLPGASMPHVLGELQGWQVLQAADHGEGGGHDAKPRFELVQPGALEPEAFRRFVADTVNFMAYAAEPGREKRIATGIWVMLYLLLLTVLAFWMKHEWWKGVH